MRCVRWIFDMYNVYCICINCLKANRNHSLNEKNFHFVCLGFRLTHFGHFYAHKHAHAVVQPAASSPRNTTPHSTPPPITTDRTKNRLRKKESKIAWKFPPWRFSRFVRTPKKKKKKRQQQNGTWPSSHKLVFGSNFPLALLFLFLWRMFVRWCVLLETLLSFLLLFFFFLILGAIFSCKYRPANHKYENNPTKCVEVFCLSVVFCFAHFFVFSRFRPNKLDNPVVWRDARFGRRAPHTWRWGRKEKAILALLSVDAIGCILFFLIFRHHFTFIRLGGVFIVSLFWTSSTAEFFESLCDVKKTIAVCCDGILSSLLLLLSEIVLNSVRNETKWNRRKQTIWAQFRTVLWA